MTDILKLRHCIRPKLRGEKRGACLSYYCSPSEATVIFLFFVSVENRMTKLGVVGKGITSCKIITQNYIAQGCDAHAHSEALIPENMLLLCTRSLLKYKHTH